jgi:hypothetical protein
MIAIVIVQRQDLCTMSVAEHLELKKKNKNQKQVVNADVVLDAVDVAERLQENHAEKDVNQQENHAHEVDVKLK